VRLSYHLLDAGSGATIRYDNPRVSLDAPLWPDESTTLTMRVEAPTQSGDYAVAIDLLIEDLLWLSHHQPELAARDRWVQFRVAPAP
jgi:hypothetical protein